MWHKEISRFIKSIFIDYDSNNQIFYNNYYFKDNIVLKIPLAVLREEDYNEDLPKIEKFDITKYVYLLHYE
jgi:hypothetical protein